MTLGYVLPIRCDPTCAGVVVHGELATYLAALPPWTEVLVVDGSPAPVFDLHRQLWAHGRVRHLRPHSDLRCLNGKVAGVLTGLREARAERVVVADDDVRWGEGALRRAADLLGDAELVRPQNYFDPLPWHALWDTARTLVNRALGADYPGTLALRRLPLLDAGGYDGDVLFENLELIRTVRRAGGRERNAPDLYVARRPPSTRRFVAQRVRQAYDDFALPVRMVTALSLLPAATWLLRGGHRRALALAAVASIGLAEVGRRRAGGTAVYPVAAALLAPLWVTERAVCAWLALASRWLLGGCLYRGAIIRRAASSSRAPRGMAAAESGGGRGPS